MDEELPPYSQECRLDVEEEKETQRELGHQRKGWIYERESGFNSCIPFSFFPQFFLLVIKKVIFSYFPLRMRVIP